MSDEWEDLRPDSGDYGISVKEALGDVACFLARIVLGIVLAALRILLAVAPLVFVVVLLLAAAKYLTGW